MSDSRGWDAHEAEQRRRWQALTAAERLAWLWQAKLFTARAQAAAEQRKAERKSRDSK